MYAFNENSTGILERSYGNGGEGNSTSSGATTPYGHYPVLVGIADGKMYIVGDEHSPNNPMYKGSQLTVLTPPPERKYGQFPVGATK